MPRNHQPGPSSHEAEDDTTNYSRASYSQESSDQAKWPSPLLLSSSSPKHQTKRIDKRIWSPHDEAIMLAEMIKYQAKGKDVVTNITSFTKIVKSELSFNLSFMELKGEILRIKNKFKSRYGENKDKNYQSDVKQHVFNMSKVLWGVECDTEATKGKEKAEETSTAGSDRGKTKVEDVEFVGDEKRAKLKRKLKYLKKMEEQGTRFLREFGGGENQCESERPLSLHQKIIIQR